MMNDRMAEVGRAKASDQRGRLARSLRGQVHARAHATEALA